MSLDKWMGGYPDRTARNWYHRTVRLYFLSLWTSFVITDVVCKTWRIVTNYMYASALLSSVLPEGISWGIIMISGWTSYKVMQWIRWRSFDYTVIIFFTLCHAVFIVTLIINHLSFVLTGETLNPNLIAEGLANPRVTLELLWTLPFAIRVGTSLFCVTSPLVIYTVLSRWGDRMRMPKAFRTRLFCVLLVLCMFQLLSGPTVLISPTTDNNLLLDFYRAWQEGKQSAQWISRHQTLRTLLNTSRVGNQKNIFYFIIESGRADMMTPYEPWLNTTPFIHEWSKQGVIFQSMHTMSTSSMKSDFTQFCGMYPGIHTRSTELEALASPYPCLPSILAEEGYNTTMVSASTWSWSNGYEFLRSVGFQTIYSDNEIKADGLDKVFEKTQTFGWDDNAVLQGLEKTLQQVKDRPLFLAMHTGSSHFPFTLASGTLKQKWDYPYSRYTRSRKSPHLSNYLDALSEMDRYYQVCIELLEKYGYTLENTLFVITSDHGVPMHERGLDTPTDNPYENSYRVPFILVGDHPDLSPRTVEGSFHNRDIMRTIASLAGIQIERQPVHGRDIFDPKDAEEDEITFSICQSPEKCRIAWWRDYKLIWRPNRPYELYNWREDPEELLPLSLSDHWNFPTMFAKAKAFATVFD